VETGAGVPGYSGGFAAWVVVSCADFLSRWVSDPGCGAERFFSRRLDGCSLTPLSLHGLFLSRWFVSNMNKLLIYENYDCNI
jgi:hypothetical protein